MNAPKAPKTLKQVTKELSKIYHCAAYVRDLGNLNRLRLMKNCLHGMANASAIALLQSRLSREPLPGHWRKFIRNK